MDYGKDAAGVQGMTLEILVASFGVDSAHRYPIICSPSATSPLSSGEAQRRPHVWNVHKPWSTGQFMSAEAIRIVGARQHNLKNLSLDLPLHELIVITF